MSLIGDVFSTGDGLSLSVSLVLLEIPNEAWIKASIINALNTMVIERNWAGDNGDITPEQAQQIASLVLQTIQFDYEPPDMIPVGTTVIWHLETPPEHWLICNGEGVLKSSYPALYDLLGGKYGESTDYFGLPNLVGRSPFGADFTIELDEEAGEMTHVLSEAEMPSHVHRIPKQSATVNAAVNVVTPAARTDNPAAPHVTTDAAGGNNPHNNLHPVLGVNFIIYAGQ